MGGIASLRAQPPAVPNGDFELWDTTFMPPRPTGFTYYTRDNLPVVVPDSNARWGNLCARMESLLQDTGLHGNVFNGRIIDAHAPFPDLWGGSPYPLLWPPDSIVFYYKYTFTQPDTAEVYMVLKKFGAPIDAYPGGNGVQSFLITDTTSQWQRFSAPIGWLTRTPDTVFLAFLSTTRYHPKPGSTFWLDSIYFLTFDPQASAFVGMPIFNGGFELWDAPIAYYEPTGWQTNNAEVMIDYYADPAAAPSPDAASGNTALKVFSEYFDFKDTTVGYAVLMHTYTTTVATRPDYLLFDYRSWIDSPNAAWVKVQLGEVQNDSFLVYGEGIRYLAPHAQSYRTDTVLISYSVPHDVITVRIEIVARSPHEVGDSLIIDNLRFEAVATEADRPSNAGAPLVYGLVDGKVAVELPGNAPATVTLYTPGARLIYQAPLSTRRTILRPPSPSPLYIYRIVTPTGVWSGAVRMPR